MLTRPNIPGTKILTSHACHVINVADYLIMPISILQVHHHKHIAWWRRVSRAIIILFAHDNGRWSRRFWESALLFSVKSSAKNRADERLNENGAHILRRTIDSTLLRHLDYIITTTVSAIPQNMFACSTFKSPQRILALGYKWRACCSFHAVVKKAHKHNQVNVKVCVWHGGHMRCQL